MQNPQCGLPLREPALYHQPVGASCSSLSILCYMNASDCPITPGCWTTHQRQSRPASQYGPPTGWLLPAPGSGCPKLPSWPPCMTSVIYSWNGQKSPAFSAGIQTRGPTWKHCLILNLVSLVGWDPAYARCAPLMSEASPGGSLPPSLCHMVLLQCPLQLVHPIVQCSNFLSGGLVAYKLNGGSLCTCISLG